MSKIKNYFLYTVFILSNLVPFLNSSGCKTRNKQFKKGTKLLKMIIGYTGILFFGAGLLMSVFRLIKNLSKTN